MYGSQVRYFAQRYYCLHRPFAHRTRSPTPQAAGDLLLAALYLQHLHGVISVFAALTVHRWHLLRSKAVSFLEGARKTIDHAKEGSIPHLDYLCRYL
jgi:hypothetical protein